MKVLSTVFLVLAFTAVARAGGGGDGDPTESLPGVIDLTPDTFSQHVNGGKHVLLEFYAPWCGHCKRIVGELKKLGELVQSNPALKTKVVIAKVNADSHRSLGDMFGVQGFPTIKFLARGKVPNKDNAQDYQGARTAEKFLEFLLAQIEQDKGFARIDKFNDIATTFVGHAAKETLVEEAVSRKADLTSEEAANADIYIAYMKRAIEKGTDYLAKEKARLDKIIASGSVNSAKLEDFSKKVSVLGHFVEEAEE